MSGSGTQQQNANEPKNSKFKQQQLPAWQPILTAGTVLPTFFVIGLAFIPIGVGLMYFSNQVQEVVVDYTECMNAAGAKCSDEIVKPDFSGNCECILQIEADKFGDKDWEGPVYMYYGLTNFYQNHRRYVKSRDDKQLYGDITRDLNEDCDPFKMANGSKYAPCGAIANSLFNDSITLQRRAKGSEGDWTPVDLDRKGIAWPSDKKYKFQNPKTSEYESANCDKKCALQKAFEAAGTVKPMDWQKPVWELDPTDPDNNGFLNEDLIVWMRTAALPNFRKLYRRIIHNGDLAAGLPASQEYQLTIQYNYKVTPFKGTKSVILATTSLLGGKNPFLGIAYIVVGCICFLMGILFLFIHLRFGRTTQEMLNIGPQSQYNSN